MERLGKIPMIEIDGKVISKNFPPYLIAEAGINHNGDVNIAKEMVFVAKEVGADAIKFQTYKTDEFCNKDAKLYPVFKRCELRPRDWLDIKAKCDRLKITFLSTPQNYLDLQFLLGLGVRAIKIGSDDLNNLDLIEKYAETNLPLIISCGMAYENEIAEALDVVWNRNPNYPVVILHCTSLYPTNIREVNMRKLMRMGATFPKVLLGYSDHTIGYGAAVLAVGFGAKVFETHFTMDNKLHGPDHAFSKNPDELKKWIVAIREAHTMMGSSELRPTKREEEMRNLARRSITAIMSIKKGQVFTDKNIGMRRPGDGLQSICLEEFMGCMTSRDIKVGEKLKRDDIDYVGSETIKETII